jgi:hypothetical protein
MRTPKWLSISGAIARSMAQAVSSSGSSTFTTWKRRASAASFSKYFLYSPQVVAAMVRSSPRASAGLSRLAASFWPAAPPAPIMVCASSMNRMIGCRLLPTSSITFFRRFSNSPLTLAPACSRPMSSVWISTPRSTSGTSPPAMRKRQPFDHGGLADARLAGQDRVVLAPPHQDVDHLADLGVAADHRIDLAVARARRQAGRVLVERGRASRRRRLQLADRVAGAGGLLLRGLGRRGGFA